MNNKPIYIYEGGGLNPEIIGTIDTDPYATHDSRALFAKMSKRVNNVTALEVTTSANSEAAKTITNTSDLVVYDNQGEVHEFHITELVYTDEYSQELQIYAEESICELQGNIVTGEGQAFPTTKNPSDYLNYILFYTRFTVGIVDTGIYDSQWKEDITGKNCLEALQLFIEKYNCEFQVRYTTDNKNRITGRYIDIKTQIGNSYGKRFEDDKDILKLSQKLNLDSVKTAIYPRIAKTVTDEATGESATVYETIANVEWSVNNGNPTNKPLGETILRNPDADKMLKRLNSKDGSLMERVMYAEWDEESCPNGPESLIGQAWAILRANGVLVPSLEVSATDLYRLSGENPDYSHELVSIGDECTIVDKSFDEPIRLELRVMEIYEDLLNPVNTEYNFGKYRRTLATSNLEQQKTLEEQIKDLESFIKGPIVAKPQYQGGKPHYEGISEEIQNAFMSAEGYTYISDSEGLWVFDKPETGGPTKAVILKGGQLAIAKYNLVTNEWRVSTFIDGDQIDASMINTGKISANIIEANSITTEHLAVKAVSDIRSGLVSSTELTAQVDGIIATTTSMGQYNLLRNTDFRSGMDFWSVYKNTDSSADKVSIETNDKNKSGMMSGERALCIWGTAAETGNKNIGAYQDVVLTPGVSYTLAYWVNCSDCSMKMSINSVNASNVVSEVALKTYKNINGDHNRTTWKYDSLSFTVPSGITKMRVTMTLTNATTGTYRAFLVKPMLSTGINAQAWTGHPDEMHIGVVSITEEKGVMVEHSDTNTYTTLNSEGLQVWDRNSSTPVAYFGEGQTAYVPTISTDMVYSKSVTPQLFIDKDITIYFSDSGSGNASGLDKSNPARGFTGAMAVLCNMLGIDDTHITGGFTVTSATPVINTIKFIAVGTNLYSGIYLQNISGAVNIWIEFPKDMALRGTYVFRCISCPIWIRGNKTSIDVDNGAIVKRVYDSNAGSFNSGMIFYNCSAAELTSMRFFCADNSHQAGIEVWYSNIYIGNTDIKGWAHGIYIIQESTVYSHNNCGVSGTSGIKVNNGIISVSGVVPKTSRISSDNYRDHMIIENASMVGTGSQAPNSRGTIQGSYSNTSRSINIKGVPLWYESIRGNYKIKDLYQGSANNSETDKYVGRIYLPSTFQDAMISASGISMAIYLERNGNIHGDESADVYIDGYSVGSLKRGEGKWFNLPDTTVTAIRSGSRSYIELNGTSYIMFVRYAQISLSATKTV